MAEEASKAPVSKERTRPERRGKALARWKEDMKMKGPPSARSRYAGGYAGLHQFHSQIGIEKRTVQHKPDSLSKHKAKASQAKQHAANEPRDPGTKAVEDSPDQQSTHVRSHGGEGEHEVQAQLLLIADANLIVQLLERTVLAVDTLGDQHRLEGGEAKDDAGRQQAVDNSGDHLQQTAAVRDLVSTCGGRRVLDVEQGRFRVIGRGRGRGDAGEDGRVRTHGRVQAVGGHGIGVRLRGHGGPSPLCNSPAETTVDVDFGVDVERQRRKAESGKRKAEFDDVCLRDPAKPTRAARPSKVSQSTQLTAGRLRAHSMACGPPGGGPGAA